MTDAFDHTPLRQHPYRWRLSRAGFVNVWHYYENTFDISGGRLILRGTNGSGKSRALEMLLPFLLDADRRNMGTGSSVRMEDLMSAGAGEQGNRLGYMWLEVRRDADPVETDEPGPRYLTLGALVRFAVSTKEAKVWYFTTPLRVGAELPLLGVDRQPLSRRDLAELITEERITDVPEKHRERVRSEVFGLTGQLGKERFDGLAKLLHTLRSPDVGNRIEEGRLPAILADALPPLSEDALTDAGQQLDGLTTTREDQQRLEAAREQVRTFLDVYRKYVIGVLTGSLQTVRTGATTVQDAVREAERLAAHTQALEAELTGRRGRLSELTDEAEQLDATLQGLRESEAYRSIEELRQLTTVVRSLATAADAALTRAADLRREEAGKVADAGPLADDVSHEAATVSEEIRNTRDLLVAIGLTEHELPAQVRVDRRAGPRSSDVVRTSREGEPEELARPVPDVLMLVPADLSLLTDAARRVEGAARTRSAQAANRAADARLLSEERRKVDRAADEAAGAETRAEEDVQVAQQAAEQRDDVALGLVDRWRTWMADPATTDLLGIADWSAHPILGLLLTDRTSLCGDGDGGIALLDLDGAADDAASTAAAALAAALGRLDDADAADRKRLEELGAEQARLQAAHDPDPAPPAWVAISDGVPLWRCLDFADHLGGEHRAGIEAALLASGLLTATVDGGGRLTAANGQLLVSPTGDPVPAPLSAVVTVDPASPVPADAVLAILDRIGLDDRTATTWIARDGSWCSGPLRGRYSVPAARHIGAAARAAARAARLAEIEVELAALADAAQSRQWEREQLEGRQRALRERQRSAPRSMALAQARTRATEAVRQAARSSADVTRLRAEADKLARAWAEHDRDHRRACSEFGLPTDEDSLRRLQDSADRAAAGCTALGARADAVDRAMNRYGTAVEKIREVAGRRAEAEHSALAGWRDWQTGATKLQTLTETVGAAAAEVQRQVTTTESLLTRTKEAIETGSQAVAELSRGAGTAGAQAQAAISRVADLRSELAGYVNTVLDQLSQPGIADTAFPSPPGPLFTDPAPEAVIAEADTLLGAMRRGRSDENALLRAQQTFEQGISSSYDVSATIAAGVRLFELVDAEGRRPLAQAAVEIDRQCEVGRATLTEREHQIFSKFVLGEVGEELRRRLSQANSLISAMNTSLKSIRTSHGIGVRLTWRLAEDASGDVAQIKKLIATAAAMRTPAQDTELTELLSARVAAEAVKDPTAGYAVHLRGALDYRAWHTVEVIITGPEEGRERRISRRAKLSQGETRFVSYVTLFAAVDAYLSGLDSTATSLRLILLDDAFAKVDEPTIAELLGLLVRLDVDFVMTGHALWGCVPQVPALDIYEICREDGTPAATAHVRWDGRNRHFLHAT
ncbi:TIGR02680 family protein [Planosporangium thailandense]|uniref:TIGR02680 family protein n=1 Tax=Planosporangium thailandense TaxID=765197 RepID=A0ABX0Y4J6_9ACTN|nr:TIGR02680 family protein [Planosporangium thailandense]NJC73016.1 TIGR02680 family protein [Planosporangium thailandense]